jgi:ubiquinone biosynthesis protein
MRPAKVLGQLRRYRQIVDVLVKHELGYLIDKLGLSRFRPRLRRRAGAEAPRPSRPRRVRQVLESLGATFVKLGQLLSTRADLLPPEYIAELARLQDQVPPCPFEQIRTVVEGDLGGELSRHFRSFDREPAAAASIGQVHLATLGNGTPVAVKVQRPEIAEVIEIDLSILQGIARFLDRHAQVPGISSFEELLEEFARAIRDELEYPLEGRNAERFGELNAGRPAVAAPAVMWDFSGPRVLTMERLEGVKVSELAAHPSPPLTGGEVMQILVEVYLHGILVDGFFHADPHPGNLAVLPDKRLAFVDFGLMGRLPARVREQLADLFVAVLRRDAEAITSGLLEMGIARGEVDRPAMSRDVEHMLARYYGMPLKRLPAERMLEESLQVAFRHHLILPPDLALAAKTVSTLDGLGRQLDPEFNLSEAAQPIAAAIVAERIAPGRVASDLFHGLRDLNRAVRKLPDQLAGVLDRVATGNLQLRVQHEQLQKPISQLHLMMNRLSFSLIIGALILGSALVLQADIGPFLWGVPAVGVVGFAVGTIWGLWLLLAMSRSGRL